MARFRRWDGAVATFLRAFRTSRDSIKARITLLLGACSPARAQVFSRRVLHHPRLSRSSKTIRLSFYPLIIPDASRIGLSSALDNYWRLLEGRNAVPQRRADQHHRCSSCVEWATVNYARRARFFAIAVLFCESMRERSRPVYELLLYIPVVNAVGCPALRSSWKWIFDPIFTGSLNYGLVVPSASPQARVGLQGRATSSSTRSCASRSGRCFGYIFVGSCTAVGPCATSRTKLLEASRTRRPQTAWAAGFAIIVHSPMIEADLSCSP